MLFISLGINWLIFKSYRCRFIAYRRKYVDDIAYVNSVLERERFNAVSSQFYHVDAGGS